MRKRLLSFIFAFCMLIIITGALPITASATNENKVVIFENGVENTEFTGGHRFVGGGWYKVNADGSFTFTNNHSTYNETLYYNNQIYGYDKLYVLCSSKVIGDGDWIGTSITGSHDYIRDPYVWREITTSNPDEMHDFYKSLFFYKKTAQQVVINNYAYYTDVFNVNESTDFILCEFDISNSKGFYLGLHTINTSITVKKIWLEKCSQSDKFAQITYNGNTYDFLSQPINIMKDSDIEVSVKVNYKEGNGNEKIYLTQNTEKVIEIQNKVPKAFKPVETFDKGKDIYLLIIDEQTGEAESYRTKLMITDKTAGEEWFPDSGVEGLNFKLGKETGFTIPESVPVFGDTEIKWDFGFIPISVEYDREDSNKINVVFGTSIAKSDGEEDKYFKNFDFKKYKKDFKKAASKQGRTLKQLRNDFKMTDAYKKNKMNLFGGKIIGGGSGEPSFDFDVAGYAEMKVIDGKLKFTEGQLCLTAEVSYTYQGQLFIWVVPVYYEIGGGVEAGFEGNMININPDSFKPEFEAYLTAKIKANLGAGVGVAKVATVGVAGEGSLNLKTALHKDYIKSWGEGSANFNVKVFGKEVAKKDFAKGDFLIYETGNSNGLIKSNAISLMSAKNDNLYSKIDINSVYENESREYTKNPSNWCKNEAQLRLMSAEFSNKNQKKLAENVYTESAPMMCEIDGKKILVMLWDNIERSDSDRTMLVYSVYDSDNDIWSEPIPVADDGTADFYPCFNDGYLVWQNQKNNISGTMTLAEIAEDGEICLAKWNGNGFDMPAAITGNSTLDTMPFVASNGNETSVVWTTNTENNILGISGTNSIMKRSFNGTNWGDSVCVKSNLSAITDLTAGYANGVLNIAYVTDSDNDFETLNDRDISLISGTTETAFTDNDVLDSNPAFDDDKLYYYSGGNIAYSSLDKSVQGTVFEEAKTGLTDAFALCSNASDTAILWTKAVEGGTEIFCAIRRDGEWSNEIRVSNTGNQSRYPTGILENDGTMYIAFNNAIWGDNEIEQSDLYTLSLIPSYDISVEDAYVDEDKMTVYATIKNSGELPIEQYTVSITDNGVINSEITVSEPLKAGESAEIELEYIKPENLTYRDITFNVAIEDDEYNLSNNSVDLAVGHCDIEVGNLESYEILPMSTITATINNIGYSDSGRVIASLRKDTSDGEVAETQVIDNLSAGASQEITFNYNIVENDNIKWYVTTTAENEEISLGNNDAYIINNYTNEVSDYKQAILRYAYADNTLTVNAYAENNTNSNINADFIIGVYSSTNKLKALSIQNAELSKYDSISPNFTIDEYVYENGDYIKLFLLENLGNITPLTDADYALLEIE